MSEMSKCPVGTKDTLDQNNDHDMNTVGVMNNISSEIQHIPSNNYVFINAETGKEISFVSGPTMTSPNIPASSSRMTCALGTESHVTDRFLDPQTWRTQKQNNAEVTENYRSTLEIEVASTKKMLNEQQIVLSSMAETMKALQAEIKAGNRSNIDDRSKKMDDSRSKVKVANRDYYDNVSASSSSESDYTSSDEEIQPAKKAKHGPETGVKKLDTLFNTQNEFGEQVHDSLAKSVNRGIANNFSLKDGIEMGEKYLTPENCEMLVVPKLNEELYFEESIGGAFKKNDGVLQKTQGLLTKGMIPVVKLMDKMIQKGNTESEEFDLAMGAMQLLAYTHRDLSNVRRKFLKPAVDTKYKRLCAPHIPLTSQLFGDDLDKQLKAINERKRIGVQMSGTFSKKRQIVTNHRPQSTSSHGTGHAHKGEGQGKQPFLYKQRGGNVKQKRYKPHSNPHQKKTN